MNLADNPTGSKQQEKAIEIQAMKKTHYMESSEPTSETSTNESNYVQRLRYTY
jgi:hypothetical protein